MDVLNMCVSWFKSVRWNEVEAYVCSSLFLHSLLYRNNTAFLFFLCSVAAVVGQTNERGGSDGGGMEPGRDGLDKSEIVEEFEKLRIVERVPAVEEIVSQNQSTPKI
jgi:hypothetical protein